MDRGAVVVTSAGSWVLPEPPPVHPGLDGPDPFELWARELDEETVESEVPWLSDGPADEGHGGAAADSWTAIARIDAVLDGLDPTVDNLASPAERLALISRWRQVTARVEARLLAQTRHADRTEAAMLAHGTSLPTWLAQTQRVTAREAGRHLARAERLDRFGLVGDALTAGTIGVEQADAIVDCLHHLPGVFDPAQLAAAQSSLLGYAAEFDTRGLRRLGHHIVTVIAPDLADQQLADRLERERRAADPEAGMPTLSALRADALCEIVAAHQRAQTAPAHGGDRPRLMITLNGDDLADHTRAATTTSGEAVAPSEVRRIACDAMLLPVMFGGRGQVLDVGTDHRLATAAIRIALAARDGGCVMPGCDRTPAQCEAHHVIPWHHGGPTAIDNLVLLCRHHRRRIEPRPQARPGAQWEIRFDPHRIPHVIPPDHVDPNADPSDTTATTIGGDPDPP